VSEAGSGSGSIPPHRARLFPLPHYQACPLPFASARNRKRFRAKIEIDIVTNRCIDALNRLYNPTYVHSFSYAAAAAPASFIQQCQPDIHPHFPSGLHSPAARAASSGQLRVLRHLRAQSFSFVSKARAWLHQPACDIDSSVLDVLTSLSSKTPISEQSTKNHFQQSTGGPPAADWSSVPIPTLSNFSSQATAVVPLRADRVALPDELNIVPLVSVLPPEMAAIYSKPFDPSLMRDPLNIFELNAASPLRPPRIAGSRSEYVKLVGRLLRSGMISFTSRPLAINGIFTVGKDADSDRLIIDAQPANRLFVDSPHVSLPDPSVLAQLQVPPGTHMFVGKSDLSNYYHYLGLPEWMRPYFCLPALSPEELLSLGLDPAAPPFPMCLTLPMGFSHAVLLANSSHEHVLYSAAAVKREDNILCMSSPSVTNARVLHGIVIDDFFTFSLNQTLAQRQFDRVLAAYRSAGFIVKDSKVVRPTSDPVKVIGFEICGATSLMTLSIEARLSLIQSTVTALRIGLITGTHLAHLVGRWTWCVLVRRPALALFQRVYHFINVAGGRRFSLWPSVARELWQLIGILPLLEVRLDTPMFPRALATDASSFGGGIVSTPFTPELHRQYWPLCSSRRVASTQVTLHSESNLAAVRTLAAAAPGAAGDSTAVEDALASFSNFYSHIESSPWSTILSVRWRDMEEHINSLELRAVLLAAHWLLSFPSSHRSRVYLLIDSTVAFYSLWKGRSSSVPLLRILRQISALLLAGDLHLLPGWVPSEVNPADGPSRLLAQLPPTRPTPR
jgi:hypothetical protein